MNTSVDMPQLSHLEGLAQHVLIVPRLAPNISKETYTGIFPPVTTVKIQAYRNSFDIVAPVELMLKYNVRIRGVAGSCEHFQMTSCHK